MYQKPTKPDDSECCGSGCRPCIFDVYEETLKKWELKRTDFVESKSLNQIKYLPFLIKDIKSISDTLKIFKFQAVTLKNQNNDGILIKNAKLQYDYEILEDLLKIKVGEYLIMKGVYKVDSEIVIISRSYTPILASEDFVKGIFRIIVSFIPGGKMSQFFMSVNINDIVFWRGPYQEFAYHSNSFKNILLIGGGTGVVPLYNIAKNIVENNEDDTWVNVLSSFKNIKSILLRKELKDLNFYWNCKVSIFITNHDGSDFKLNYNETVIFNKINETVINDEIKKFGKDEIFIVVCGPNMFNEFVKNILLKVGVENENIFIFW